MAKPPVTETHREAHQLHRAPGHERNARNVEQLLHGVRVEGENWCGMLGEVMRAVKFPQRIGLVHAAMVPVEPEVQDDGI